MKFPNFSIFLLLLFTIACSSGPHSDLQRAASMADDKPEQARKILDSIDYNSLRENDRYYYNLLDIKTKDKLYITHTSDSLILAIVDYYSQRKHSGNYTEALYYTGRVYSDLGDYPASLKYFQQALDLLPPDTPDMHLRGNVLSQMGRMLNTLRLYREAIPYIKSAIEIDSMENNIVNTYYDFQLLGSLYMNMDQCDSAETYFRKAYLLASDYSPKDKAGLKVHLAAIKQKKGEIDSALYYVRGTPDKIWKDSRSFALSYAAEIYHQAQIYDTAYMYARELSADSTTKNRRFGYIVLSSPPLNKYIPKDSLYDFYNDFRKELIKFYDNGSKDAAIWQNSIYNYSIHDRERTKADAENSRLKVCILVMAICLLVALCVVLLLILRNKMRYIYYRRLLDSIMILKNQLLLQVSNSNSYNNSEGSNIGTPLLQPEKLIPFQHRRDDSVNELQSRMREELKELCSSSVLESTDWKCKIEKTDAYKRLIECIKLKKHVDEEDKLWIDLRDTIHNEFPMFFERLDLLSNKQLKTKDMHTIMLIKCGVKPADMRCLFLRTKGAISQRRETLCKKLFGGEISLTDMDKIIRSII